VHEYRSDFLSSLTVEENDALERYFDSLASTMITLFMSIANGVSWENVLYPLMKISPFWVLCFLFFAAWQQLPGFFLPLPIWSSFAPAQID